ncbi:MAG: hypothetical protein J0648_09900 [Pelodictyon phaeoclathratiforme]|jgi:hypothetical protein|nr:hypothetical protein [Pelodictyon phaeoclathratiforme]
MPDRHAHHGRMEYSKIEEREKAPEKGSIAWQSGIVIIERHGALFFCHSLPKELQSSDHLRWSFL